MADGDVKRLGGSEREGEADDLRAHLVHGVGFEVEGEDRRTLKRAREEVELLFAVHDEGINAGDGCDSCGTRHRPHDRLKFDAFFRLRLQLGFREEAELNVAVYSGLVLRGLRLGGWARGCLGGGDGGHGGLVAARQAVYQAMEFKLAEEGKNPIGVVVEGAGGIEVERHGHLVAHDGCEELALARLIGVLREEGLGARGQLVEMF